MTPLNMAANAGCFMDEPAIPPMDLAACTSDDVDRALRKKALDNVARFGMPKGLPGLACRPLFFRTCTRAGSSPPVRHLARAGCSG